MPNALQEELFSRRYALMQRFQDLNSSEIDELAELQTRFADRESIVAEADKLISDFPRLTQMERAVYVLLLKGLPNKIIEHRLMIREQTVTAHMGSVYRKLNVHSRREILDPTGLLTDHGRLLTAILKKLPELDYLKTTSDATAATYLETLRPLIWTLGRPNPQEFFRTAAALAVLFCSMIDDRKNTELGVTE